MAPLPLSTDALRSGEWIPNCSTTFTTTRGQLRWRMLIALRRDYWPEIRCSTTGLSAKIITIRTALKTSRCLCLDEAVKRDTIPSTKAMVIGMITGTDITIMMTTVRIRTIMITTTTISDGW